MASRLERLHQDVIRSKALMKVTQEKLPASQIGLEIEIPSELTQKAYDRVVQQFKRSANIPGFRKGKVPRHILIQRLGANRLKAAALEDLIQDSLKQAIEQENIDALGNYQLRSSFDELALNYQPGETLTFSAAVDVPPEVDLGNYEGLELQVEQVNYDPARVDEFLEEQRAEQATLVPVEGRAAQFGDVAILDYNGRFVGEGEAGEPVPGAQAEDFEMELQEGRFIEGLIEGIVGMNPGDTKEIEVRFPDDYAREELAGKPAAFTVTLKDLKQKELPELNDDFAQEVSEFETLAELCESVEDRFKEQAEKQQNEKKDAAILARLVEQMEVDLPESMVDKEIEVVLTQTAMQLQNYGIDINQFYTPENIPQMKERSRPEAIDRLKQDLAVKEVAKRKSIEVEDEAIEQRMQEISEQLADRDLDPDRLREFVQSDLLKEKTLDWLKERANFEYVPEGSLSESEEESEDEAAEDESPASEATVEAEAQAAGEEE